MNSLLQRIEAHLAKTQVVEGEQPLSVNEASPEIISGCEHIRQALSGCFGEAIEVSVGSGKETGCFFAAIPVKHLKASGLRFMESLVPPRVGERDPGSIVRVLVGSPDSAVNASNRVMKPLGEGWKARLDSFPCGTGDPVDTAYFRIEKA